MRNSIRACEAQHESAAPEARACCWCVTTGLVAVQVVEVLRQLPQRDLLAEAINFNAMGPHEVATLGRVLR